MGAQGISREVLELRPYVVKVLWPGGAVNGTGFFCHPEGFVLTCRHVVDQMVESGGDVVELAWGSVRLKARFRADRSPGQSDLAVLETLVPPSMGWEAYPFLPLDVHERLRPEHRLESFGFPQGAAWSMDGISVHGTLGGSDPTRLEGVKGLQDVWVQPLQGFALGNVQGGFSGAPVLDPDIHKVVGIMVANERESQAFLAPLKPLFEYWKNLRDFHDVRVAIRENLRTEAEGKLKDKLQATPWVVPELECGLLPPQGDDEKRRGRHGRLWSPLGSEALLGICGRYVLSADVGTGKTMLLRWLGQQLLEKTDLIPLFLTCEEARGFASLEDLRRRWIDERKGRMLAADLEYAIDPDHICLLCDGLDQVKAPDYDYASFAQHAFGLAPDQLVLVASRPSTVLALEPDQTVIFLGLRPFSEEAQAAYFGEFYAKARRLTKLSPDLARVPMLAFMLRQLIAQGQAEGVTTRTELFDRYWDHTTKKHETNLPFTRQNRTKREATIKTLRVLAYRALAQTPPQIQTVAATLYDRLKSEAGGRPEALVSYEELPRFGLLNLMVAHGGDALYFTHQSYQDYLAALHTQDCEEAKETILEERWNPKWQEVIRFLAGREGEPLIRQILKEGDDVVHDNIIHSNLFLAAQCADEMKGLLPPAVKQSLEEPLLILVEHPSFWCDAMAALSQLGAARRLVPFLAAYDPQKRHAAVKALINSREPLDAAAFQAITEDWNNNRAFYGFSFPHVVEQFEQEFELRLGEQPSPETLQACAVFREKVAQIRAHLPNAFSAFSRTLEQQPKQFENMQAYGMRAAAERIKAAAHESVNTAMIKKATKMMLLSHESNFLAMDLIVTGEEFGPRGAALRALANLREQLSPEIIPIVASSLSDEDSRVRRTAIEILGRLGERLGPETLQLIAMHLQDEDTEVRRRAVEVLEQLGKRLGPETIHHIAAQLGHENLDQRESAYGLLKTLYHKGCKLPSLNCCR
jgi:hypothetical protein